MFSSLSRSIPRRTVVQSVRFFAQKPSTSTGQSRKKVKPTQSEPKPETNDTQSSGSTLTPEPLEPTPASGLPTLDFSPPEFEKEFQRTGAKSSKGSLSTNERKRRSLGRVSLTVLALAFGAGMVYMGRDWEEDELKGKKMRIEDAPSTRWARTKERFTGVFNFFTEPAWPELLPPQGPPHKPFTLLISIDDLLVTSIWDRQHGWRTAKRPGVDYFLGYISQFYEVVVFTTQPYYTAVPILEKLDRYNFYISHRLFREATRTVDGKIVKDLSYLNRDLSKVILLDTDPEHASTHPENAIILPKWKGDPQDKGLVSIIPFLESIAIFRPPDARPILQAYAGKNIPLEYGKVEAEMKARHIAEWQSKNKGKSDSWIPFEFSLRPLFGLPAAPSQAKNLPPPTYLEEKRNEAQQTYQREMKYVQDNKQELERMIEQEQEAMAALAPGSLWEAMDTQFRGKPPADTPPGEPVTTPAASPGSVPATSSGQQSPSSTPKTS